VAFSRIIDRQAAIKHLVGFGVGSGLYDRMRHVILLREESGSAQDDQWKTVPLVEQPTKMLGGEFADPINVARMERGNIFIGPGRTGCTVTTPGTKRLRDHHLRGRGEHKSVDCGKRLARRLEQVERALHID